MKQLFEFLSENQTAIIVAGIIIIVFMIVFKEVIRLYLIKQFDLYTADEVAEFTLQYTRGDFNKRSQKTPIYKALKIFKKNL